MATRPESCVVPVCDVCGNDRDEDGIRPHFPTVAEAVAYVVREGWNQLPDGRLVCDDRDLTHEQARDEHGIWKPGRDAMSVTFTRGPAVAS